MKITVIQVLKNCNFRQFQIWIKAFSRILLLKQDTKTPPESFPININIRPRLIIICSLGLVASIADIIPNFWMDNILS